MKVYEYEGKTTEELKEKITSELSKPETELVISIDEEEKTGLFKGKKATAKVIVIDEVIDYVKQELDEVTKLMGIKCNYEINKKDDHIKFTIYSDNNAVLIGKNGRTLESLQVIIKQSIYAKTNMRVNLLLDIEGYKENQQKNIEYLAKKIAKEVRDTKVEAKLFDMNSYERRLVHSTLTDFDGVYTESEGQEPNRYVVIKPKED